MSSDDKTPLNLAESTWPELDWSVEWDVSHDGSQSLILMGEGLGWPVTAWRDRGIWVLECEPIGVEASGEDLVVVLTEARKQAAARLRKALQRCGGAGLSQGSIAMAVHTALPATSEAGTFWASWEGALLGDVEVLDRPPGHVDGLPTALESIHTPSEHDRALAWASAELDLEPDAGWPEVLVEWRARAEREAFLRRHADQRAGLRGSRAATPEPPPSAGEGDVWAEIIERLEPGPIRDACVARRQMGLEKYGQPLQRGDGRDHAVDEAQEHLDAAAYRAARCGADDLGVRSSLLRAAQCLGLPDVLLGADPLTMALRDAVEAERALDEALTRGDEQAKIIEHIGEGHTVHCAKGLVWGSGECGCSKARGAEYHTMNPPPGGWADPFQAIKDAPCRCFACLDDPSVFPNRATAFMVLCSTCGNKRCPHATDHRLACTGSNEPGQPGSRYSDDWQRGGEE